MPVIYDSMALGQKPGCGLQSCILKLQRILPDWMLPVGCYELYAVLGGEQRSFWQESCLCVSDVGGRIAQRLLAGVPPSQAQHGKDCMEQGSAASQALTEQLHAKRWQSCDLDMEAVI